MKRILLSIFIAAALVSCKKENEFEITGSVKGLDGKTAILQTQDQFGGFKNIDTAKIKDGKFKFHGIAKEGPEVSFIEIDKKPEKSVLILEGGDISIEMNKDSLMQAKPKGTYNNDELVAYQTLGKKLKKELQKEMEKFRNENMAKMQQAQTAKDTATIKSLQRQYAGFQEKMFTKSEDYVKTHPKSLVSVYVIQDLFGKMPPDLEKIKKYFNGLDKSIQQTKAGKEVSKKITEMQKMMGARQAAPTPTAGVKEGSIAPDFSAKTVDGKTVSLKESMGKLTIVDFWASWCGPCRAENPNVVALYKDFHSKGLNIIGVSLDDKADSWKAAIVKDNLTWTEVSNLLKWKDPIAMQYGVDGIPATFLIDASGKVLAKNLRGEELRAKIASILK